MNREKIHILKVTLTDEKGRKRGRPYRIIAVKGNTTLYRLAEIIVESSISNLTMHLASMTT